MLENRALELVAQAGRGPGGQTLEQIVLNSREWYAENGIALRSGVPVPGTWPGPRASWGRPVPCTMANRHAAPNRSSLHDGRYRLTSSVAIAWLERPSAMSASTWRSRRKRRCSTSE